jgi:hypothetical protein
MNCFDSNDSDPATFEVFKISNEMCCCYPRLPIVGELFSEQPEFSVFFDGKN